MTMHRLAKIVIPLMAFLAVLAFSASSASAEVPCVSCVPWWHLQSRALPTNLPLAGGSGTVVVTAENEGDAPAAVPVVLTVKLPASMEAQRVGLEIPPVVGANAEWAFGGFLCSIGVHEVTCTDSFSSLEIPASGDMSARIAVAIASNPKAGEAIQASVSGGGAANASITTPVAVSGEATPFGVAHYELLAENADGSVDTQAGSHPFQLTSVVGLKQTAEAAQPPAAVKDLHFDLPPGLVGNPTPLPQCPLTKFLAVAADFQNHCQADTAIGVSRVTLALGNTRAVEAEEPSLYTEYVPLFNLVPDVGEPARFGFVVGNVPVYLDTAVRTGGDYGVRVDVNNISELAGFVSSAVTFWGVPGDPRHDASRGWDCLDPIEKITGPCTPLGQKSPPSFLVLPTSCAAPLRTSVEADSWEQQGLFTEPFQYTFQDAHGNPARMDGCNRLPFSPSINVTPDGQAGSTPTGLTVDEHVPQGTDLNPTGLAESAVKGLSVTLPEGVALNPAAADGLQACSLEGIGLQSAEAPTCPEAAKVATVKIKTPLLPNALEGAAYLAAQNANPFGSLVAMYIYAKDPVSGVRVKAAGEVLENETTGQLTAHFEGDPVFAKDPRYAGEPEADFLPEVPFEDVELHFFGGDRAPLGTPPLCGSYKTVGTFTPWSGGATTESSSEFQVTSGPNGSPCQSPLPFAPSLAAGTTSNQAGGFSPFTMTMSREDGNQNLQAIALHMPPGLSGLLSNVKLCGEPQADEGTCGPESEIGETTVSVGLGGDPFSVTGGKVFITGPYNGSGACVVGSPGCAPFGLSIVNPAKAGPYDLEKETRCDCVVVRAKIEVDPHTAALTVSSNDSGPYKIPTILKGIPLQIKHVNVTITGAGGHPNNFTFNPTNCNPLAITGTLDSTEGATRALSVPFQATNCAALKFAPKFAVSTSGKTSKANGASLTVKLTYPKAPFGSQANIRQVKVDLPKRLPSRLTTLQKACTAAQFKSNPAGCPAASIIGHAKAITPLLPVPLEGPAYFVSNGGEAFPNLIVVLQGDGVTIDLVGTTFISKSGITSSTFKTVPDQPVGSFELTLPEGKYSALAANGNLCTSKLAMPTEFVAQNGLKINESTPIAVTGCSTAISIVSHKIKGRTLTVSVSVGAAGILTASGKGLSRSSKSAKGRETLTFKLTQKKPGKLSTKLKIAFKPSKGGKQAKSLSVKFNR
jgi:hypothetical protein